MTEQEIIQNILTDVKHCIEAWLADKTKPLADTVIGTRQKCTECGSTDGTHAPGFWCFEFDQLRRAIVDGKIPSSKGV